MIVYISGVAHNEEVISVTLWKDISDPKGMKLKMFFCPNCKFGVIQYKGAIASIMPGAIPHDLPLIARCASCKTKYLFVTIL